MLSDTPYSFKIRFENDKGINPEELIAAAHAGRFTMVLAFGLQLAGFTPTELTTEAAVTFYIGLGETFDGSKVQAFPPGSVLVLPGDTWHFHWAKSGECAT